jgi:hypothetical protein
VAGSWPAATSPPANWPTTYASAREAPGYALSYAPRARGGRSRKAFQIAKNEAGLDQYQVRRYDALVRPHHPGHGRCRVPDHRPRHRSDKGGTTDSSDQDSLIRLTVNEIRRLFATLILAVLHPVAHVLAWSAFRQLCNQRARATHYRKRLERLGSYDPP